MEHYRKYANSLTGTFYHIMQDGMVRIVENYSSGQTSIRTDLDSNILKLVTKNDCHFGEPSTKEEFEKNFVNAMIQNGVFDFYKIVGMAVKESVQKQIKVRNN